MKDRLVHNVRTGWYVWAIVVELQWWVEWSVTEVFWNISRGEKKHIMRCTATTQNTINCKCLFIKAAINTANFHTDEKALLLLFKFQIHNWSLSSSRWSQIKCIHFLLYKYNFQQFLCMVKSEIKMNCIILFQCAFRH